LTNIPPRDIFIVTKLRGGINIDIEKSKWKMCVFKLYYF